MAVFIFGAGATRGCSFVDPQGHPCLPPLDGDFFTHLQRVQNPKHKDLIERVMQDVVELFGPNFSVTMETVFATLEHTARMLNTTGENRDFKKSDLVEKRRWLEQAIAAVLEDSLTERDPTGRSKQKARECRYHEGFIRDSVAARDTIISFNYDCVLDYALKQHGSGKWNAQFGYGLPLGPRSADLKGYDGWQPERPSGARNTVHLFKLHGSVHFQVAEGRGRSKVKLKQRPYTWQRGTLRFSIIPPESGKAYDKGVFANLWKAAAAALHRAKHVVVVGYSLPTTDLHSTALLRTSVKRSSLRSLVVVNPDRGARKRVRTTLQRGLNPDTRVLSYDRLSEFVKSKRAAWAV